MFRDKVGTALKDLIEQAGNAGAVQVIREAFAEGKLKPEDFSLREIWEACEGGRSVQEAVTSDLFPKITGELINAKVVAAYEAAPIIGNKLVTEVPSKLKTETVTGFESIDTPDEVPEGAPYAEAEFGEKYVTIDNKKYGRIVSITEEMIHFDQTGQVLARAQRIGEKAALYKEKLILEKVQDVNSDAFKPNGVATALYRTSESSLDDGTTLRINSKSSTPFGESGMEDAWKLMQKMEDENGDPIFINPMNLTVLVPADLWVPAQQLAKSTQTPESAENAINVFAGTFTPLTSYYITKQSATTWYVGDFKQDFWWLTVWPLQTLAAKPGSTAEFEKDIKARFKVRFFGGCGAIDYRHSFKFTT